MRIIKIFTTFCLCILSLMIAYAQPKQTTNSAMGEVSQGIQKVVTAKQAKTIDVLAIDLNADGKVTESSIRNLGDGILLLYMPPVLSLKKLPKLNPELTKLGFVPNFDILTLLDEDRSGRIDALDASYHHMYVLVFYDGGKRYKIIPLSHVGVRALFLKKEHMKYAPQNYGEGFMDSAEKAVFSDSNKRVIKEIKVKKKLLDNVQ